MLISVMSINFHVFKCLSAAVEQRHITASRRVASIHVLHVCGRGVHDWGMYEKSAIDCHQDSGRL